MINNNVRSYLQIIWSRSYIYLFSVKFFILLFVRLFYQKRLIIPSTYDPLVHSLYKYSIYNICVHYGTLDSLHVHFHSERVP